VHKDRALIPMVTPSCNIVFAFLLNDAVFQPVIDDIRRCLFVSYPNQIICLTIPTDFDMDTTKSGSSSKAKPLVREGKRWSFLNLINDTQKEVDNCAD
jgi:hypothetical protein